MEDKEQIKQDMLRELSERRLSAPYLDIRDFPNLTKASQLIADHLNGLRKKFDLEEMASPYNSIRLIEPRVYNNDISFNIVETGAFFDPIARKSFIRFDPDMDLLPPYGSANTSKTIGHEETHRAMEPTKKGERHRYSESFEEGLIELITLEITYEKICPLFLSKDQIATLKPRGYNKAPEVHNLEFLNKYNSRAFEKIMKYAFHGDSEKIRQEMENAYGRKTAYLVHEGISLLERL